MLSCAAWGKTSIKCTDLAKRYAKLKIYLADKSVAHGTDDITALNLWSQVNYMRDCSSQVGTLIYYSRLECLNLSINFDLNLLF